MEPEILLDQLKQIEYQLGRRPGIVKGPRPIDLDILIYEGKVVNSPKLVIPHPGIAEREFVLRPFSE